MADLATVKPPPVATATHSGAPEPHSSFCTMYAPPTTARRCELHSEPTVWPPDAPAADAVGELGELADWLAGLWVWMAPAG